MESVNFVVIREFDRIHIVVKFCEILGFVKVCIICELTRILFLISDLFVVS